MSAAYRMMMDKPRISSFPATQHDISRLKQTAMDAVNDMGDASSVRSLGEKVTGYASASREYVSRYPLRTLGTALAIGFVLGLLCNSCGSDKRDSSS